MLRTTQYGSGWLDPKAPSFTGRLDAPKEMMRERGKGEGERERERESFYRSEHSLLTCLAINTEPALVA